MNSIDKLIDSLNKEQKEAVLNTEGPNLIVAGAGSGKTSVLIARTIHLLNDLRVSPSSILALTFTNKAAEEMRVRIGQKTTKNLAKEIGFYTFHGFCYEILRNHIKHLGYQKKLFSIR